MQTAVERIAGPRAVRTSYGCAGAHNVRFVWRSWPANRRRCRPVCRRNFSRKWICKAIHQRGWVQQFGNTWPQQEAHNSAENPAELIRIFLGMFEMLFRDNSGLATPDS